MCALSWDNMATMNAKTIYRILIVLGNLFAVGVATVFIAVLLLLPSLPDIEKIRVLELKVPLRIYSSEGLLMGEYGSERRIPLRIADAPARLIAAVLAAEDDRYYEHVGIDYQGLLRAIYVNLQSGSRSQGASTITMQVTRNFFLTRERTYTRKAKEALLALRLEQLLSKDEILELYLNKIFLGHRSYGFAAAADVYYGVPLSDLSIAQYAMLAALPKAPSSINPISNPQNALNRRNYVLNRMLELGYIDEEDHSQAISESLTAKLHLAQVDLNAPYIVEHIRQIMYERYGESAYEDGFSVYSTVSAKDQQAAVDSLRLGLMDYDKRHGYRGAHRNLDLSLIDGKDKMLQILHKYESSKQIVPALVLEVSKDSATALTKSDQIITIPWENIAWARPYISSRSVGEKPEVPADVLNVGDVIYAQPADEDQWQLTQIPKVEGALIAIDPKDGAVKAMVGGFDYYINKFNRVTQAVRQMGSNIKPFIYSAALENGYTPASLVSGAPVVVEDEATNVVWRPENYSGKFYGDMRLRKALSLSLNLVSVRLLRSMGTQTAVDHISNFGFDKEKLPNGLALALGSAEATPLAVATGYAAFANGGYLVEPYAIDYVKDRYGKTVFTGKRTQVCDICLPQLPIEQTDPTSKTTVKLAERVISSTNAYIMGELLRGVVESGTARKAQSLSRTDIGGKTGTTNNFEDAWFSGFSPHLAATVWVGFDTPSDLGRHEAGSKAALPIWINFMQTALEGTRNERILAPDNVVRASVHSQTGEAVSSEHPQAIEEVFVFGTQPKLEVSSTASSALSGESDEQQSVDELF